jgi:broad specificity phosphatase PhoE
MVLTLLRHAPLPIAYQGRYIGHSDIPIDPTLFQPLTLPYVYDLIFCSDLRRCTQTLEQLGYRDYQTDERLREVRFKASYEGKSFDEIERMDLYNPRFLESEDQWHNFICDEKAENFHSRIASFLEELPREQNILICAHAGTIREILFLLENRNERLNYLEYTIVTVK